MQIVRFRRASVFVLLAAFGCGADTSQQGGILFDSALAERLGADELGMRSYVLGFLKTGPTHIEDSTAVMELFRAHQENIRRLADEGRLVLAGPFLDGRDGGPFRGLYVFNVSSLEEAREIAETDPAVQAGWLAMELHPWYGTAALQELHDIHRRVARRNP